ncbi:MAG: hypothetical protein AAFQ85_06570 [Pseudomonadota bacterium]
MFEIDNPFVMVVLIVAISVSAGVVNTYLKTRENTAQNGASRDDLDAMRADIARLNDRVRVLEKIATDKDRVLSDEISRLA